MRIDEALLLKSSYKISFGCSLVRVLFYEDIERPNLGLCFTEGPKFDQVFTFEADEKEVRIGRMVDCQVRIDDSELSRYQAVIRYEDGVGWAIYDGDGTKASTNGTWLFLEEQFELRPGFVFKAGSTLFKVKSE
mmetsp:Transcript_8404/g.16739  ORF Transcript_8404/g.16739 Transcript_8404/m.16739 type:complete len:134 (-) Transcript_8404:2200-2601(-)